MIRISVLSVTFTVLSNLISKYSLLLKIVYTASFPFTNTRWILDPKGRFAVKFKLKFWFEVRLYTQSKLDCFLNLNAKLFLPNLIFEASNDFQSKGNLGDKAAVFANASGRYPNIPSKTGCKTIVSDQH
ncbi:hypothetical protein D3C72_1471280 [compost metagenome]